MSDKLKINHRPGATSAEIFLREVRTTGNQYTMGDGGEYGYTITLQPESDDVDTLIELFNEFAAKHAETHEGLKAGYNPINKEQGTFTISWKGKYKNTMWTNVHGEELEKNPALADNGCVSIAIEVWSRTYDAKTGDTQLAINCHPAQIRVHSLGDAQARINNAFDDWMGDDALNNTEDF